MDLRQLFGGAPPRFDFDALVSGGSAAIGVLLAVLVAGLLMSWAQSWADRRGLVTLGSTNIAALLAVCRDGLVSLFILVGANLPLVDSSALLVLAVALGFAMAAFAVRLAALLGAASSVQWTLALLLLLGAPVALLGGLRPLRTGLDAVGIELGNHRISLLSVVSAAVVAALLYGAARGANRLISHLIGRSNGLDEAQQLLLRKLAGLAVVTVAVLLGLDLLGISLTSLAVFSGAFGLAVGFGLQKTLGNLLAGLILLMDRSIKPGDVIVVGDTFGAVNKIGVRAVSVVTRDGKEHLIPNEQLMTEAVENWSYSSRNVRIHIDVGVSYLSDIPLAQRLMVEAAKASKRVLASPAPTVWLKGFGDSSVDHDLLVWVADPEAGVGNVRSEILNRLWVAFKQHGIEIPFPQRDLHIKGLPGQPEPPPPPAGDYEPPDDPEPLPADLADAVPAVPEREQSAPKARKPAAKKPPAKPVS